MPVSEGCIILFTITVRCHKGDFTAERDCETYK